MSTTIETVFEKGVFRPLQPVALPEHRRVRIRLEDESTFPRLMPRAYDENASDVAVSDLDMVPVPPKAIHTVQARLQFTGKVLPKYYHAEEK